MWILNQQNLAAARQKWLARQEAPTRTNAPIERIEREANWVSNELMPPIQQLVEQGYAPDDQYSIAEMLIQQGLHEEGEYIGSLSEAEWESFVDFGLRGAAVKTALVSDRLKRAYTRLLEIVPEDVSMELAAEHLQTVFDRIAEEFELTDDEANDLRDMTVEKWPRLEIVVEATRCSWMDDFIRQVQP